MACAPDLPLYPEPSPEWIEAYSRLMENEWLARKTDRTRRVWEHHSYIYRYCRTLEEKEPGLVIDIGPGPGEFLEFCRKMGHQVLGIDAASGTGGMGDDYLAVSKLMTERQRIPVEYVGWERWIFGEHQNINGMVVHLNSRGSIEQALSKYMKGDRHDLHHQCKLLHWELTERFHEILVGMFKAVRLLLREDGAFLIVANGSQNDSDYDEAVHRAGREAGLKLVMNQGFLTHKWVKN